MGSVLRRDVDQRRALLRPGLFGHRFIRYQILAERVLELPGVAPVRRVAVLQPEDARGQVGRNVLLVRQLGDVAVLVAEDLDRVVAVADGALVERALDAVVGLRLPGF